MFAIASVKLYSIINSRQNVVVFKVKVELGYVVTLFLLTGKTSYAGIVTKAYNNEHFCGRIIFMNELNTKPN